MRKRNCYAQKWKGYEHPCAKEEKTVFQWSPCASGNGDQKPFVICKVKLINALICQIIKWCLVNGLFGNNEWEIFRQKYDSRMLKKVKSKAGRSVTWRNHSAPFLCPSERPNPLMKTSTKSPQSSFTQNPKRLAPLFHYNLNSKLHNPTITY